MSYDIHLKINTGKNYVSIWDINITSNVRNMYNKAFNVPYWVDVVDLQKCHEVKEEVSMAYEYMRDNENWFRPLQPENGWGKYEDALRVLKEFKEAVMEHENCTIEIYK